MGMKAEEIEGMMRAAFPKGYIELQDLAGDNDHYSITVTDESFRGKTRVAQHKMVFDALGGHVGTKLHALAVITKVPLT